MERNDKLHHAVGFCMKAGKLQSGDFAAEKLIKGRKALLGLIDSEASENTREKYAHLCAHMEIPLLSVCTLGKAIGKPGRMVAAVTDEGFTNMIMRAAGEAQADTILRG